MAIFEKMTIVDERGNTNTITSGIIDKKLDVKQSENSICVTKEDIFNVSKKTTCINRSNMVYKS